MPHREGTSAIFFNRAIRTLRTFDIRARVRAARHTHARTASARAYIYMCMYSHAMSARLVSARIKRVTIPPKDVGSDREIRSLADELFAEHRGGGG